MCAVVVGQVGTPTAYGGLTLGGVLATTADGTGDRTISAIWDTLLEITWVCLRRAGR